MKSKVTSLGLGSLIVLTPVLASAAYVFDNVLSFLNAINDLLSWLFPVFITIAVLIFLWGVVQFLISAGDEEKRKSGRATMVWGIVAIAVMVSVWGLVNIMTSFLPTGTSNVAPLAPREPVIL